MIRIRMRGIAGMTLLGMLAGCAGGTEPDATAPSIPAQRLETGLRTMDRMAATPILASFQLLGRFVNGAQLSPIEAGSGPAGLSAAAGRIATVVAGTSQALLPVMRPAVYGTTYVFDPAKRTYVPDPARRGAPANGVRFVLYEAAGSPGEPVPGREIGHADLTDELAAHPTTIGLRLEVVSGGITHLRYSLELSGSLAGATLAVAGFLTDGTERLNFTVGLRQPLLGRGGPMAMDATVALPAQSFEVTVRLVGAAGEPDEDHRVEIAVRSHQDRIAVDLERGAGRLDATFTVNGRLLARATGDPTRPVIRGENGRELTADELRALAGIIGLVDGIFRMIAGLVEPVAGLLAVALGLAA